MALEPTQVNLQVQHFSHIIKDLALPLDRYTKPPPSGNMYSISAQLKPLKTFEKRNENPVEEATSGESSPCQSDSEIETRSLMPDLQDVSNVLTEELSLEVDESLERLRDFNGKGISFVFENFDYHFRSHRLSGYIKDIRVSGCHSDKILSIRNIKDIVFAGSSSYHVEFSVRRPELLYEFILRLQEYLRNETRRQIKIVRVLGDRRKRGQWNAVIIRNLQPRVTQKELETQCKREVVGPISVGTIVKIKDRFSCIVRCDYMEDAEAICKRLNNFLLKDPQTYEKYYFKAHLHPQCSLKHFSKEKSIFSDYLKSSEKAGPKAPSKTGINDLLDMFQKSKKPTSAPPAVAEKSKTQPSKEPSDKTKNGPTTGTDMLIQSISSSENREVGVEASGLSMLIKSTSSIETTATNAVETLVKSHSHKEIKPSTTMEEETKPKEETKENITSIDQNNNKGGLVITKAEDKNKRSRSKSPQGYKKPYRYDERSSHYQNRKTYDDKKYEKRTKRSKSKSRSKSSASRSRSKSKSPSRRYKTEKSHKHRNGTETRRDSPHKSRSKERKRHHHRRSKSKSRSKSPHSKSRSHSKHHHRKSSPGRKKPFIFEYKINNSDSERSRSKSPSKKLKKSSRSKSKDRDRHNRYKNDYKTTSSYKSQYRDRRDDRGYNDHHKSSYSRRERSGSRHRDSYTTDRKDYHYKGKDDYYERRKRDYDYDKDHRKTRRRSRSKGSRSKDKRSRSKSASRDRKRTSSTGRNGHRSTSRDRKTSHKNPNTELKIEKNEGNKNEVATAKN